MREALFLPHHDVTKPTVAFILADAVPEPLVKDVVLLGLQLPLHGAVQVQASVGQSRAFQNQKSKVRTWPALCKPQESTGGSVDFQGKCPGSQGRLCSVLEE